MIINNVLIKFKRLCAVPFAMFLLAGCLGDGGSEQPAPEVLPRTISYKTLDGKVGGEVLQLAIHGETSWDNCGPGGLCLSSFASLLTQEAFQSHVASSTGSQDQKDKVLAAGNAADFSREQIWAFKYGSYLFPQTVTLNIEETESRIEVQAIVCSAVNVNATHGHNIFVIVPKNLPNKPVTILTAKVGPSPEYTPPNCIQP